MLTELNWEGCPVPGGHHSLQCLQLFTQSLVLRNLTARDGSDAGSYNCESTYTTDWIPLGSGGMQKVFHLLTKWRFLSFLSKCSYLKENFEKL